jgi:hypothetical protein
LRYLLTSNIDPSLVRSLPDDSGILMARFVSYTTALAESGVLRGAEQLLPPTPPRPCGTGRRDAAHRRPVRRRRRDLRRLLDRRVARLDGGSAHARPCPAADVGSVEVRGIVELG